MTATTVPLSWQQKHSLTCDPQGAPPNLVVLVPMALDASDDEFDALAHAAVRDVEALRLRVVSADEAEIMPSADIPDLVIEPVRTHTSEDALRHEVQHATRTSSFDRRRGPLCRVVPYELADDEGTVTQRWLGFHIDHFVTDAVSLQSFKDASAHRPPAFVSLGGYGDWLRRQDLAFRDDEGPAAEFWREHLEGADLAVCDRLPARIAGAEGYEPTVQMCTRVLRESNLEQLCGAEGVTPFMVLMTAVVITTATMTGASEPTLVLSTHGRDETSVEVFGYLANLVPVHVHVPTNSTPLEVLEEVATAVLEITAFCNTPWPYLHRVLGFAEPDALGESTVTLNHVTQFHLTDDELLVRNGSAVAGAESGLWIDVVGVLSGGFGLLVKFDPTRYDVAGVEAWADDVVRWWEQLVGGG